MIIKILGTGCPKCKRLGKLIQMVVEKNNIDVEIVNVTDIDKIISYGVMMTPGLVIDEDVKSAGRIPSKAELLKFIKG